MAWTLEHTDTFNRANTADINGSTMSDGLGLWSVRTGGAAPVGITTNQATKGIGTAAVYYDANAPVVTNARCSLVMVNGFSLAPAITLQADGSGYFMYPNGNLYKYVTGVGFTQLAAASGAPANGSVIMIEKIGSTLVGYDDGVQIVTVVDATYGSGRPGHYSDAASGISDTWVSYAYSSSGGVIPYNILPELTSLDSFFSRSGSHIGHRHHHT